MESDDDEIEQWDTYPSFEPSREDVDQALPAAGRIVENGEDEYDPWWEITFYYSCNVQFCQSVIF